MKIPLSAPDITESEIDAVVAVLRSSQLSLGPKLQEFEHSIAQYVGVSHAIAVSSGTSGLHLCVRALGIGEGDEVIVPSFTFVAAANAIRYERATPVFVDIDPLTLNLDPARIENAITPRTRAIMLVHTFGYPAELTAIQEIAKRHQLLLIEDACEAIGAEYGGEKVGSFGSAAVFAFYPNKQITTGEGGVIVTRDASLARKMKALRNHGRYDSDNWFQHTELGFNYRPSDIHCALGIEQLKRIDQILARREAIAREYTLHLSETPGLILPILDNSNRRISWFVYVVRLQNHFTQSHRDAVVHKFNQQGIACGRYFAPIHMQPSYSAWRHSANLPVTESQSARTLALPFFNKLTSSQIHQVADTLKSALHSL
jgi:perosamine synthetase